MSGGGGSKSQVVGYRYYFGLHMGVCRGPVDSVVAIRVGDKGAWVGNLTSSGAFNIDNPALFGGDKGEGGIQGSAYAYFGEDTQGAPAALESMTGIEQPGFRRMFTLWYDGLVTAMNPYPKAWKMRVRRVLKGWQGPVPAWVQAHGLIVMTPDDLPPAPLTTTNPKSSTGSSFVEIILAQLENGVSASTSNGDVGYGPSDIHAMNPAAIIYECLTNSEWGRGLSPNRIDQSSFEAAAITLKQEGFGLCLKWARKETIANFIKSVIDHIAAVIYTDRSTGLVKIKLVRSDYVAAELPLFTPDTGLIEVTENDVANTGSLINEMQVTYRHPVTNEKRTVRTDNLGAIKSAGGVRNTQTKEYIGLPTASLALRVAQRDLRAVSTSIRRYVFKLDRRGYSVNPGDAIRIADPTHQIRDTVVRVGAIEDCRKDGYVKVTAVQDVFALPSQSFGGSAGNIWAPPRSTPCLSYHKAFELPYFMVARNTSAAEFAYLDPTSAGLGTVCDKGQPVNGAYDITVKPGAPTSDEQVNGTSGFCSGYSGKGEWAGWVFTRTSVYFPAIPNYYVTPFSALENEYLNGLPTISMDGEYRFEYATEFAAQVPPSANPGEWQFRYNVTRTEIRISDEYVGSVETVTIVILGYKATVGELQAIRTAMGYPN